jgi:hypothetical protein
MSCEFSMTGFAATRIKKFLFFDTHPFLLRRKTEAIGVEIIGKHIGFTAK